MSEGEGDQDNNNKSKPKWNILGSIKKFFFKENAPASAVLKTDDKTKDTNLADSGNDPLYSLPTPLATIPSSVSPIPEPDASFITPPKKADILKDPESAEPNKYIDDPIELKNLEESEDVIFEFYYNRIKTSELKTIYELINYQPTHRSVADPQVIYFKIKEQNEKDDETDEQLDIPDEGKNEQLNLDKQKTNSYEKTKHQELVEIIKSN